MFEPCRRATMLLCVNRVVGQQQRHSCTPAAFLAPRAVNIPNLDVSSGSTLDSTLATRLKHSVTGLITPQRDFGKCGNYKT